MSSSKDSLIYREYYRLLWKQRRRGYFIFSVIQTNHVKTKENKVLIINTSPTVQEFKYMCNHNGLQKDIKAKLGKARDGFVKF